MTNSKAACAAAELTPQVRENKTLLKAFLNISFKMEERRPRRPCRWRERTRGGRTTPLLGRRRQTQVRQNNVV